jgi:hypothetical protein
MKRLFVMLATILVVSGCAHKVDIAPNLTALTKESPSPKINKAVGYYISEGNRALLVTTPAGGGDSVKYTPYADIEPGLNLVLSKVFSATYMIEDINDQMFLKDKSIAWIFTPKITTTSSSRNAFFWPPTDFSMTINCIATDNDHQQVWNSTVQAEGELIAVKEILKDYGLAGRSAAENTLLRLQDELLAAPVFRQ